MIPFFYFYDNWFDWKENYWDLRSAIDKTSYLFHWILSFTSHTENINFKTFYWGYGKQILTGARNLATMSRLCSTPKKRCKDGKQQPFQILAITAFSSFWQNNGFLKFWQQRPFHILANCHFKSWRLTAILHPGKLPFQILANDSHSTFWQTAFPILG